MVEELLRPSDEDIPEVQEIFASSEWLERFGSMVGEGIGLNEVSDGELRKVSHMKTPQQVLALVRIPEFELPTTALVNEIVLGLEAIRDPGNLGTIIRTADWFGIKHILCTPDSVDLYNPKVVQSTMGAIARIRVYYTDMEPFLQDSSVKGKAVYGTFLDGENIYETQLEPNPLVLFGNESRGLSAQYDRHITSRISIPSFAGSKRGSESLNLAASVAIVCSELRRRN